MFVEITVEKKVYIKKINIFSVLNFENIIHDLNVQWCLKLVGFLRYTTENNQNNVIISSLKNWVKKDKMNMNELFIRWVRG